MFSKAIVLFAFVCAVCCHRLPLHAQLLYTWGNTTNIDTLFHQSSNWNSPVGGPPIPRPTDTAVFNATGNYLVAWNGTSAVTIPSVGFLQVTQGDVLFQNLEVSPHALVINGSGGPGSATDLLITSLGTKLTTRGLHLHSLGGARIAGATLTLDGAHPAGTRLSVDGASGFQIYGNLNVTAGARVNSTTTAIGNEDTAVGTATVAGVGSRFENSGDLSVGVRGQLVVQDGGFVSAQNAFIGKGGVTVTGAGSNLSGVYLGISDGRLNVVNGAQMNHTNAQIGYTPASLGFVTINGNGSQWNVANSVEVGYQRNGTMSVQSGGVVNSSVGSIGVLDGSTGIANVTGAGSQWNNSGNLQIGSLGAGTLNIADSGKVAVGGVTSIGTLGTVNLSGAGSRFEFGQTTIGELNRINASGGSMAGNLFNAAYSNAVSFNTTLSNSVNVDDVKLTNSSTLYGNGNVRFGLNNTPTGQIETIAGERMRFAGNGSTNAGEINNFGGQIRFDKSLTNQSTGFVGGRGQFIADGGWTNSGVMAFSAGLSDVLGDVTNQAGARIITSGAATTTFYDDVINQGEIRTSLASSSTVFLGGLTGAGSFTGAGTVYIEGDLRPGNSPAVVSFGGNLSLGSTAITTIELGGLSVGEFDKLLVAGDLSLNNSLLNVSMWNGFTLGSNMQFLIAGVNGNLNGQFNGLSEGGLVGNFGGTDLFITYNGLGGQSGIGLITAVPEPTSLALFAVTGLFAFLYKRTRKTVSGTGVSNNDHQTMGKS